MKITAFVSFFVLGAALNGLCSPPSAKQTATQPSSLQPETLVGTVEHVDVAARSIEVKDRKGQVALVEVDKDTTISRKGVPVKLPALKAGDFVVMQVSGLPSEN